MNISRRKPRPIRRDEQFFRDDRLFIVACDDTYAPKQYFDAFQLRGVKVHMVPATDGEVSARHVLNRLLEFNDLEDDDERWMLLDTDHYIEESHFPSFIRAISDARQQGIKVALSKPCFEIWLLLHHVDGPNIEIIPNAVATDKLLREKLGKYNKTKLCKEHFPLVSVPVACRRAKAIDQTVKGGDRPEKNTTRVYQLWESIVSKALPTQLPPALRTMIDD